MKLLFILTFKGSLEKWAHDGIANREMEVPFEYLRRGLFSHIQIFTYSTNDRQYLEKLNFAPELKERIELIMPDRQPRSLLDLLLHSLSIGKIGRAVRDGAAICKTNQINGCWTALLAMIYGCPVLLRCGYLLSRRFIKSRKWPQALVALCLEIISFNLASIVSVTTDDARVYVSKYTLGAKKKIFVAPTYVNIDIFKATIDTKPKNNRVLFVGRLEPVKNVAALINACKQADMCLTIVGRGSLEKSLLEQAKTIALDLKYHPALQNEEVAEILKLYRFFALPSLYEGLPKVLIEAMAAEMICIGTPTSGIDTLIKHGKTGYLAKGFTSEDIAQALEQAASDPNAEACARQARAFVIAHHTIEAYVDREFSKIKSILR
ncbi:MAG: glycosyltransferase family 4 protein [Alphaproteobacteria bacterium]